MDTSKIENNIDKNKRNFVKKAAYTTPVIITMLAVPSFASAGSGKPAKKRKHRKL